MCSTFETAEQRVTDRSCDHLEKLTELLEQEQCELVGIPDGFTGRTADGTLRLIYLMNDAVESFLVLGNARMGGTYVNGYEGPLSYSLEREKGEYVLVVHQGESVCTLFFEAVDLEVHLYNYGRIGHFWVRGYENLRVLEYQIAILRDKYEYLGAEYCTEEEQKLAMLKDFPPLTYLFYPSVPEQYIVPSDDPWQVTEEAIHVMQNLAAEAGDTGFLHALSSYASCVMGEKKTDMSYRIQRYMTRRKAAHLAAMLHRNGHAALVQLLAEKITVAAAVYPDRDFGEKANAHLQKLWQQAKDSCEQVADSGKHIETVRLYREEPFAYDCDSVSFAVHKVVVTRGLVNQNVQVESFRKTEGEAQEKNNFSNFTKNC